MSSRLRRFRPLLVIALLIGTTGFPTVSAGPIAAQAAAAITKPNVVLIVTDDQTMQSVAKMSYLNSQAGMIKFNQAEDNNALCCPTRCSILQGRWDTHTGVTTNVQGNKCAEQETLPVWLGRSGYHSGLYGKYLNGYPFGRGLYRPAGWTDWQAAYGNPQYQQYNWDLNSNGVSKHYGATAADYEVTVLTDKLLSFINVKAAAGKPFFAAFTPSATHTPWKASPSRVGTFAGATVPHDHSYNEADVSDKPAYVRALPLVKDSWSNQRRRKEYEAAATIDDAIKRIDTTLKSAGVYNRTVLIFTTDNGYSFGNHRWRRKHCEYNECHKMPLFVRYPGLNGRTDSTSLVSSVDLAPTIAELAGATPGIAQDGRSFVPLLFNPAAAWRDAVLQHHPGGDMDGKPGQFDSIPQYFSVKGYTSQGLFKYVELDTGERELYDQAADPYELVNRANQPAYAIAQSQLKTKLTALKQQAGVTAANSPRRTDVPVPQPDDRMGDDFG